MEIIAWNWVFLLHFEMFPTWVDMSPILHFHCCAFIQLNDSSSLGGYGELPSHPLPNRTLYCQIQGICIQEVECGGVNESTMVCEPGLHCLAMSTSSTSRNAGSLAPNHTNNQRLGHKRSAKQGLVNHCPKIMNW